MCIWVTQSLTGTVLSHDVYFLLATVSVPPPAARRVEMMNNSDETKTNVHQLVCGRRRRGGCDEWMDGRIVLSKRSDLVNET